MIRLLTGCFLVTICFLLPVQAQADPDRTFSLVSQRAPGMADAIEATLEVKGEVKQVDGEQRPVNDIMEVRGWFNFEERTEKFSVTDMSQPLESIRRYELARADMRVGDRIKRPELEPIHRTIQTRIADGHTAFFSPTGMLSSEQLLLIEGVQGNTLILDHLLPNKDVQVGDSWTIGDETLAPFLYIDTISKNEIQAVFTSAPEPFAIVEIVGRVEGTYLGAATDLEIQGKYQFDLERGRITWIGLVIRENRAIGHAGPGLSVQARYLANIQPLDEPVALRNVPPAVWPGTHLLDEALKLRFDGQDRPWAFEHGRNWFITQDDARTTIMRMLMDGDLIAQCNIADLGTVDMRTLASLDSFKHNLRDGLEQLGGTFHMFAAASDRTNEIGYREYRVEMDGAVSDMELRWIYYQVTDRNGNQRIVVFVIEPRNFEAFGETDFRFMETFRIRTME